MQHTNSSLCFSDLAELNDTAAFRPGALKQDLSQLDLTGGLKQLHQVFVSRRPRQLSIHNQ